MLVVGYWDHVLKILYLNLYLWHFVKPVVDLILIRKSSLKWRLCPGETSLSHIFLLFWTCRAGCPAHVWCRNPGLVKRLVGEGVSVSCCVVCGWNKGFLVDSLARGNSMTGYWNWNISLDCRTPGWICATCVIRNTYWLSHLYLYCLFPVHFRENRLEGTSLWVFA